MTDDGERVEAHLDGGFVVLTYPDDPRPWRRTHLRSDLRIRIYES